MRDLKSFWEIGFNVATTVASLIGLNTAANKFLLDTAFLSWISFSDSEITLLKRIKDDFDKTFGTSHGVSLAAYVLIYAVCKGLETIEWDLPFYAGQGYTLCHSREESLWQTPVSVGFCRSGRESAPSAYFFNVKGHGNLNQFCLKKNMSLYYAEQEFKKLVSLMHCYSHPVYVGTSAKSPLASHYL